MIPVSLRPRNFLSYGTAAGDLDFEAFSVACLSGGNGQGKSALLDAMTWAMWGEARKSSGAQKPDDELLRVGTRDMAVEFVFDLEGTRYRITRTYHRSASGKTSKPGLEFQVLDPESGAYRALTAESIRATQALIHERLGIDYDTFINSAFLLQGRSDEFTKKKPGERKEILGKILGLDRYDRLSARAGQRYSEAREQVRRLDERMAHLKADLEGEGGWKEEHTATATLVAELDGKRTALRAEEDALRERLAALEAVAREAETQREALLRLAERRAKLDEEAAGLATQITEAEALVARAATIEQDHARYEALMAERSALDDKAELKRGLEHQHQQLTLQLDRARMELEGRIEGLRVEIEADRKRLAEAERQLVDLPRVRMEVEAAQRAAVEAEQLRAKHQARQQRIERVMNLDRLIEGEKNRLTGTLTGLLQEIRDAEAAAVAPDALRAEEQTLVATVTELETWMTEQNRVKEEGIEVGAAETAAKANMERLREEMAAVEARKQLIRSTEAETCPTCGTTLTESHRQTVEASYDADLARLREQVEAQEARRGELLARRDALRQDYVALKNRITEKNGAVTDLASVRQRLNQLGAEQAALTARREKAERLQAQLDAAAFQPERQAERTQLQDQLDAEPFDEARFETVKTEAARLGDRTARLRDLEALAERRGTLTRTIGQREEEQARLRGDLEQGTTLGPIRQKLDVLQRQLTAVGYDGARHEAVRRELGVLKEAPQAFMRLMEAQRNLTAWTHRRDDLTAERQGLAAEEAGHQEKLAAIEARLGDRAALEAEHIAEARARGEAEAELSTAQNRLGALKERLDRCAQDRAALTQARANHKEAKRESALYRHLRGAFGKHGIPSLIIEETLPEIEDRANELLERLSSGRTRVALETLKDKKTGGTKETLDIRITDEQGVARSYETFSGGEAFRVNFALRIALARLLAERSGVRIRTLVVDEGFGTQDQAGIQNLVEAIRTIQDDFDKILVITHLDELKDAFPIRIEVTKRPVEGSTFEIVGV